MSVHSPEDLQRIYKERFEPMLEYRRTVWRVLIDDYFQQYAGVNDVVLDLGCGYGEFISQVQCGRKYAMDLNPDAPQRVGKGVNCLIQDCSAQWPLADNALDLVFTSNFFEHLPTKESLGRTLDEVFRCLKSGGRLVAMGPNIRYLPGAYWDFWDHYLPLSERSLGEALENRRFQLDECYDRFLPYTMAGGRQYPVSLLRIYLRVPLAWKVFGKQFLVVARKP